MSLIVAHNISKSYPDGDSNLEVLISIDFQINKGEIIIIKGPSGSGKTTLLNILSTLDSPDSGKLSISNKNINFKDSSLIDMIRSNFIGILLQNHNLIYELTVYENICLPFKLNKIKKPLDPLILLKDFNLESKIDKYPSQLSGGELQRISLIRSVINNPPCIIADEPTANLDKKNFHILIELIERLQKNYNKSFIISTHDDRLCDIADKVYYLNNCKLKLIK